MSRTFGSITIVDTTDIERIYVEYCRSTSNQLSGTTVPNITRAWGETTPAWVDGEYIWQRAVVEKSGTLEKTYGTPVCISGEKGETGDQGPQGIQGGTGAAGRSLKSTTTHYTTAAATATINETTMSSYTWSSDVPTYNASTPAYWVRVTNEYENPSSTAYIFYKDNGITDAVKTSHDANSTAASANSTANAANQTANTANNTANNANTKAEQAVTNVNNLQAKLKYYWVNEVNHTNGVSGWTKPNYPAGTYAASGISGVTFDSENSSTYGYNTWYANGINLRYNAINLGQLTGTSLIFYHPSTSSQGGKAMELTGSALKFYDSTGSVAQATFGGTQATISGTINAYSGQFGSSTNNYWLIDTFYDANQQAHYSSLHSKGESFIQLGDNNTWTISTDKISSGWRYMSTNADGVTNPYYFRYKQFATNGVYYDYGIHIPSILNTSDQKAKKLADKFLFIRYASYVSDTNLNVLETDANWTYPFYVDSQGNVRAKAFYIGDSTTSIGGGAGTIAEKLDGPHGSANQPIYFDNDGVAQNTAHQLNAAGAKGVDTSISEASTSTNLPTSQAVAAFVEGKGYITGYTETDPTVPAWAKASTKPSYSLTEISGTDDLRKIEALTDTAGFLKKTAANTWTLDTNTYLTSYTETDPTVPAWAKASTKPSYTLSEITSADDIKAIEDLAGTSGLLKKTAANTWTLDTNNYITGITSSMVTTALGYTPYDSTNPNGYITANHTSTYSLPIAKYNTLGGVKPAYSSTGAVSLTTAAATNTTTPTIAAKSTTSGRYYAVEIDKNGVLFVNVPWTNVNSSYLTGITSNDVTTALGYTPYDSTNPNGYTTNTGTVTSVKVQGSNGLTGSGTITTSGTITLSHADTSEQASSSNSGRTYIQSITLDGYGHVTGLSTATETVTNTHNTAYLYAGASNGSTNAATTNGNTYLILVDGGSVTTRRKISGSGTVSVASDNNGNITITGSAHPIALKNPNALSVKIYNATTANSSYSPTSFNYDGSTANQSLEAAGKEAITSININEDTLSWVKADGTSGSSTVTITASVASGATILTKTDGTAITTTGSTTPVWFDGGIPKDVTGIAYDLLPTGTSANTVAIGNHTHAISLASDTATSGVVSLSHGGKYKLTAGGQSVIFTLPSDNNTDTKVKLTSQATSGTYPLMFGPTSISSGTTYEVYYNTGITVNPSTKTITATTFSGKATSASSADTASKLGSSDVGSATKPIYLSSGTATEGSTYAGGTKVTLNGADKGASTASFYAPTSAGTQNYVLIADANGVPTWTAQSNITSGNSDEKLKVATVTSGTTYYPIVGTGAAAATRQYDTTGFVYVGTNGTANGSNGNALLTLGNSTASTTANWKKGTIRLYGTTAYYTDIISGAPSANRTITLPNKTGTVALTSDIPTVPTVTDSSITGITIANHNTTAITGVSGSTTASKVTVGSHATDYGVKNSGSFTQGTDSFTAASYGTDSFTAASLSSGFYTVGTAASFTRGTFSQGTLPTLTMSVSGTELTIVFGQGTLPTHAADSFTANVPTKIDTTKFNGGSYSHSGFSGGSFTQGTDSYTAPALGSKVPTVSASDVTVPKAATSSTTVVTSATHSITDNGHTHTI